MGSSVVKVHLPSRIRSIWNSPGSTVFKAAALATLTACGAAVGLAPILFPAPLVGLRFFNDANQPIIQPEAPGLLRFSNIGNPVRLTVPETQPSQRVVFTLLNEDELLNQGPITEQTTERSVPITFQVDPASTAVPGRDYVPFSTELTVPAGQSRATLVIELINNLNPVGDRTLILNLLELPVGDPYSGAPCCTTAILTIRDAN
ncbi:hypothetical protein [Thermostichus vulcanus]|uniref:Uncharacterized protein n=1 Tax=Thermostichus vulcanus str. 'Rupite' TaxID=2813851 RepID=A0ABT0C8N0_THEVL|nr:hypothetical protein [Thermostichus vulcanus]MCJ2542148.1 hypothetical protein [Thermostichus vulcanus str. 'Rupite']